MGEAVGGRLVAVVDCGTNSTRLLLARVDAGGGAKPLERLSTITRLGAGVDASGRLASAAIGRVTDALATYARRWRRAGVADADVAVTATSAVRDVADPERFVAAVRDVTGGVVPSVLTGRQEAALTFAGATAGAAGRRVVCDIGGGSTEMIVGAGRVEHAVSMQMGSVRLRERHLAFDPPTPAQYARLVDDIDAVLAAQSDEFAARSADGPLIAVAGTALTVAAIAIELASSDVDRADGVELTAGAVAQVAEDLAWLPSARRAALHPAIVAGREDVIVAGALLLARVLDRWNFTSVRAQVADLVDGIAAAVADGRWPLPEAPATAGGA